MSSKNFKEDCIFEELKDKCFKNAKDFKEKLMKKYKDIDASSVYIRVTNYQIKKYGGILRGFKVNKGDE